MAVGQSVLTSSLDVAALTVVEQLIETEATARCAAHGRRLRAVLRLQAVLAGGGAALGTVSQLALLEQTSELAAGRLLEQALLLAALPGALEAVDCALLSVEQAAVVTRHLAPLDGPARWAVWERLQARLLSACEGGVVLSPARLSELLARWVIVAAPSDAVERRRAAQAAGGVDWRRREDGLVDLFASGMTGPVAQAVLCRIRERSGRWGRADDRPAGRRRLEALVDLLLGRDRLPFGTDDDDGDVGGGLFVAPDGPGGAGRHCGPACGCRLGEPVPCGVGVSVLVPLGAVLGTTDELAELVGHGPLEPDLLQQLLHNAPRWRPVWVDEHGVPVAVGEQQTSPPRGDPLAVRQALLDLAGTRPPQTVQPRHPDDHPPPDPAQDSAQFAEPAVTPEGAATDDAGTTGAGMDGRFPDGVGRDGAGKGGAVTTGWLFTPGGPRLPSRPHPTGTAGRYRIPTRMARLIRARAPRCGWPGCGAGATRCDLDHDRAWPAGPTCPCNLGPCCRRHHRLKQLLMSKTRTQHSTVTWTSPTGRRWTSPSQHTPPQPAVRPLPPIVQADPDAPADGEPQPDHDDGTDTTYRDELRADDTDPDDIDPNDSGGARDPDAFLTRLSDSWGLALDDPTRWTD